MNVEWLTVLRHSWSWFNAITGKLDVMFNSSSNQ